MSKVRPHALLPRTDETYADRGLEGSERLESYKSTLHLRIEALNEADYHGHRFQLLSQGEEPALKRLTRPRLEDTK